MLKKVEIKDYKYLQKLMQLYLHELCLDFYISFNSNICEYEYDDFEDYVHTENRKAYFIMDNGQIAGFILYEYCKLNIVQEIFVINNYKKMGIATKAVQELFNMYKGAWEIKCVPNSLRAEKFWNKVIKEYTNNNFELIYTGKYNRAEFRFNNGEK